MRDHGPGIPAADRPHVFDRFYRGATARGRPGSGLGLAIVRQVAETHGGTVEVREGAGGGSRFVLRLTPLCARPARRRLIIRGYEPATPAGEPPASTATGIVTGASVETVKLSPSEISDSGSPSSSR